MATKHEEEKVKSIKPGSPEYERFLSAGYPDIATRDHAKELLAMRKENPALVPFEVAERAKAFLEALDATPKAIDTEPGYRRSRSG